MVLFSLRNLCFLLAVSSYSWQVHEDFQSNMPDVPIGSLEWLSPVPYTHAPRLPQGLLGGDRGTTGRHDLFSYTYKSKM